MGLANDKIVKSTDLKKCVVERIEKSNFKVNSALKDTGTVKFQNGIKRFESIKPGNRERYICVYQTVRYCRDCSV